MLTLQRREGESVYIQVGNEWITVTLAKIMGRKVRIGFQASDYVKIYREELIDKKPEIGGRK